MKDVMVALLLAWGCNAKNTPTTEPLPEPVEPAPEPEPPAPETPQTLYAACHDRVELPQADAECESDEDCAKAGCSQEVCTTATQAAEINTICDVQPCFSVLEACGCTEGTCTWTLTAELPEAPAEGAPGGSLPPSLPPTQPAPDPAEATPAPDGGDPPDDAGEGGAEDAGDDPAEAPGAEDPG